MTRLFTRGLIPLACAAAALTAAVPASAQISVAEGVNAGELDVPVNKSQVIRSDRAYSKALIGNPDIADVLPLTNNSLYVLGKKMGTTSLTLYDRAGHLIAVMDVSVGPDVITLRRQLAELMPNATIGAHISNDSIVLEGVVPDAPTADRAVQLASTYAPDKVVNLLSIGSAQQVMLEVRISEMSRTVATQLGLNHTFYNNTGKFVGGIGSNGIAGVPTTATTTTTTSGATSSLGGSLGATASNGQFNDTTTTITNGIKNVVQRFGNTNSSNVTGSLNGAFNDSSGTSTTSTSSRGGSGALDTVLSAAGFGAFGVVSHLFGLRISSALDALEQKGMSRTLAEPTLVALSGQTASFLAGGEFPIPVAQSSGGNAFSAVTVEFKPFGVSLGFTPTVLADGVISMDVAPEVSSLDDSSAVVINGFRIPGLRTRRAKTTVELRDGESFAIAGLLSRDFNDTVRQVPLLGSIPIIGSLFRSSGFQRGETELVIVITPRLVRPVPAGTLKLPTDNVKEPNPANLFMLGQTDTGDPWLGEPSAPHPVPPTNAPPAPSQPPAALPPAGAGGSAQNQPSGFEKDYGHVL
jgi:pilus assembly protein CpaC